MSQLRLEAAKRIDCTGGAEMVRFMHVDRICISPEPQARTQPRRVIDMDNWRSQPMCPSRAARLARIVHGRQTWPLLQGSLLDPETQPPCRGGGPAHKINIAPAAGPCTPDPAWGFPPPWLAAYQFPTRERRIKLDAEMPLVRPAIEPSAGNQEQSYNPASKRNVTVHAGNADYRRQQR